MNTRHPEQPEQKSHTDDESLKRLLKMPRDKMLEYFNNEKMDDETLTRLAQLEKEALEAEAEIEPEESYFDRLLRQTRERQKLDTPNPNLTYIKFDLLITDKSSEKSEPQKAETLLSERGLFSFPLIVNGVVCWDVDGTLFDYAKAAQQIIDQKPLRELSEEYFFHFETVIGLMKKMSQKGYLNMIVTARSEYYEGCKDSNNFLSLSNILKAFVKLNNNIHYFDMVCLTNGFSKKDALLKFSKDHSLEKDNLLLIDDSDEECWECTEAGFQAIQFCSKNPPWEAVEVFINRSKKSEEKHTSSKRGQVDLTP